LRITRINFHAANRIGIHAITLQIIDSLSLWFDCLPAVGQFRSGDSCNLATQVSPLSHVVSSLVELAHKGFRVTTRQCRCHAAHVACWLRSFYI
jgi:hypothetical protein